jgi:hypothetical protein
MKHAQWSKGDRVFGITSGNLYVHGTVIWSKGSLTMVRDDESGKARPMMTTDLHPETHEDDYQED